MRNRIVTLVVLCASIAGAAEKAPKAKKLPPPSALDQALEELSKLQENERQSVQPNGSLWSPTARYTDLASDLRARHVGDIVTIQVAENASAVSSGTSKTARNSSVQANIAAAGGITAAVGPLANLAKAGQQTTLDGQGTTTRNTTLTATLSAFVTQVLPNGNLVIKGVKNVSVNSENQILAVRGVIRPIDLDTTNAVPSDRIAQMEIQVNGKGIVGDAIKRPFILYRIILGLLPF
jgi:flagellar L-ring protein FlgH